MKKFTTKTGMGYLKNTTGAIIAKFDLPPGDHPTRDDLQAFDVLTRQELEAIEITPEISNDMKTRSIKGQLLALDFKAIRALREGDQQRINDYNNQAATLRSQLPANP